MLNIFSYSCRTNAHDSVDIKDVMLSQLAPPYLPYQYFGLVGYENRGQLTEKMRARPHSVLLLDEIDQANIDILDVFLPVLDEGRMTDAYGVTVDFKNSIIIMTTNIGSDLIRALDNNDDYQTLKENVISEAHKTIREEFLNQTEHVIFRCLTRAHAAKIVKMKVSFLCC